MGHGNDKKDAVDATTHIGKYKIEKKIGQGFMGTVFLGFDPVIHRPVAIKIIKKSQLDLSQGHSFGDRNLLARFQREAQAAGRLNHPHIVSIYEYGENDELSYIVMEYVDGKSLKHWFDKQVQYGLDDINEMMSQVLMALDYAHENGVVHRDIKPSNILIAKNGQVKILDFGIARLESSELTHPGDPIGSPSYMSPEQILGEPLDGRTDIFAAGVILYMLLTGNKPFDGESVRDIASHILNTHPDPPSKLNNDLPEVIDDVLEKALAKSQEDRYSTGEAFLNALSEIFEDDITPDEGTSTRYLEMLKALLSIGIFFMLVMIVWGVFQFVPHDFFSSSQKKIDFGTEQIHRDEWLKSQPLDNFGIQILGARNENSVRKFIIENGLIQECAYYQTQLGGDVWFVVILGAYPSRERAEHVLGNLPANIKQNAPWVRPYTKIHRALIDK